MSEDFIEYECKKCGTCCKEGWTVHIDASTFRRLHKALRRLGYKEEWHYKRKGKNVLKVVEGRCIFFQEHNLCYIHQHLGYEYKPLLCRLFPSSISYTPKGAFQDVTFACFGTVQFLGEKERFLSLEVPFSMKVDVPERFPFFGKLRIGWDLYFWVEEALYEIIFRGADVETQLLLCSNLLWNIYSLLKEGMDERGVKSYIIQERNAEYKGLREQSFKYRGDVKAQHTFLLNLSSFLRGISPSLFSRIPSIPSSPIQYMRMVHKGWPKESESIQKALKKYIQYKIFGKHLLKPDLSVLVAFNVLLIYHVLIRWCTSQLRKEELSSLREAIVKVERLFYHTLGLEKVWKGLARFQILSKPEFANIILRI